MTTPTTCEPTEEQRARARQAYQQWQQGDIIARSGLPSSILDFIAQHAAQESSRANERAEGLAKELEALRADREQWIIGFSAAFAREWMSDEQALLDEALRDLQHAKARGDCELAKKRKVSSLLGQACRARDAATARVAEMQDRMVAAFGEGTTADQLVAISHEHEARVAELEKQLANAAEGYARLMESGTDATNRADAAEAEPARLRALPDTNAVLFGLVRRWGIIQAAGNEEDGVNEGREYARCRCCGRIAWDGKPISHKKKCEVGAALAAPLPSAQQVGAAPVDISLGECSAWTAPAQPRCAFHGAHLANTRSFECGCYFVSLDDPAPAQPAGHNPEGVEGKPERVPAEGPPAPGGEK